MLITLATSGSGAVADLFGVFFAYEGSNLQTKPRSGNFSTLAESRRRQTAPLRWLLTTRMTLEKFSLHLKAERHNRIGGAVRTRMENCFSKYPANAPANTLPGPHWKRTVFRFRTRTFCAAFNRSCKVSTSGWARLYLKGRTWAPSMSASAFTAALAALVIAASFLVGLSDFPGRCRSKFPLPSSAWPRRRRPLADRRDYSVRATIGGHDELGLLTNAFNQMLTEIQKLNQDLERRVHDAHHRTGKMRTRSWKLFPTPYHTICAPPLRHVQGYVELLARHAGDSLKRKVQALLEDRLRIGHPNG